MHVATGIPVTLVTFSAYSPTRHFNLDYSELRPMAPTANTQNHCNPPEYPPSHLLAVK